MIKYIIRFSNEILKEVPCKYVLKLKHLILVGVFNYPSTTNKTWAETFPTTDLFND